MPLPTTVPQDPEIVEAERGAATARFAGMAVMLTILSLVVYMCGSGPADSWALAVLAPPTAILLFIVSGFTLLKRTVEDTSLAAAGMVLTMFLLSLAAADHGPVFLVTGGIVGVAATTYTLLRNLDQRIGPGRLLTVAFIHLTVMLMLIG